MISKYTDKNKYGGYTWHITLDSLFHIFIHGTDNNSLSLNSKNGSGSVIKHILHLFPMKI